MRLKRWVLLGSFLTTIGTCAPVRGEFRQIAGTKLVVMHEDTYDDLHQKMAELERARTKLEKAKAELEARTVSLTANLERTKEELRLPVTTRVERRRKQLADVAQLYLFSLGIENPTKYEYEQAIELLKLKIIANRIIKNQYRADPIDAKAQKQGVEDNFVEVIGGDGGGGGVLISSDGYFITANHVVQRNYFHATIRYKGREYTAACLCYNDSFDAALCKADLGDVEFRPANVMFAPLRKLNKDEYVEVLGIVNGRLYYQVGQIIDNNTTAPVYDRIYYSTVVTTAYAEGGFSGGPAFLKETGELIGITSYTNSAHRFSGAARIDHFLELIDFRIDNLLKDLAMQHSS